VLDVLDGGDRLLEVVPEGPYLCFCDHEIVMLNAVEMPAVDAMKLRRRSHIVPRQLSHSLSAKAGSNAVGRIFASSKSGGNEKQFGPSLGRTCVPG
jgi:hypothetical protein